MKTLTLLTLVFALSSCCGYSDRVIGPDGTTHYLVSCSNAYYCYQRASEICGGPYQIVNTTTDPNNYDGTSWAETRMLVKCQY